MAGRCVLGLDMDRNPWLSATWRTRYGIGGFVAMACCGLSLLTACGSDDGRASTAVSVLIEASSVPDSVEWVVECDANPDSPRFGGAAPDEDLFGAEGTLELSATQGAVSVWTGSVDLGPGECSVLVKAMDPDGERTCVEREPLPAGPAPLDGVYLEIDCPIGAIYTGPPPGDLVITVQTLAEPGLAGVQSVSYRMTCMYSALDARFEITFEDELEAIGRGTIDLAGEAVPTNDWQLALENTGAGPCELKLAALDGEGTALCALDESLEVVSDAVTKLHAVLLCGPGG